MAEIDDLIARLDAATEGSTLLSWGIAEYLGWTKYWSSQTIYLPPGEVEGSHKGTTAPPLYTTSVDAALTLVPMKWRVYAIQEQYIDPPDKWFAGLDHRTEHYKHGSSIGKAPTPALALCIAALKARRAAADA